MKFHAASPVVAWLAIVAAFGAWAEESAAPDVTCVEAPSKLPTVPLSDLLESVSTRSKKEFLVDARVPAEIVVGQRDWRDVTYRELHTVLSNNELAAVTVEGLVNIVPVNSIRQYPLPVLQGYDDRIADGQWVTLVIKPERAGAVTMVPLLRPLLPPQGHLAAVGQSNTLTVVARYANARRIAEMVREIDKPAARDNAPLSE